MSFRETTNNINIQKIAAETNFQPSRPKIVCKAPVSCDLREIGAQEAALRNGHITPRPITAPTRPNTHEILKALGVIKPSNSPLVPSTDCDPAIAKPPHGVQPQRDCDPGIARPPQGVQPQRDCDPGILGIKPQNMIPGSNRDIDRGIAPLTPGGLSRPGDYSFGIVEDPRMGEVLRAFTNPAPRIVPTGKFVPNAQETVPIAPTNRAPMEPKETIPVRPDDSDQMEPQETTPLKTGEASPTAPKLENDERQERVPEPVSPSARRNDETMRRFFRNIPKPG